MNREIQRLNEEARTKEQEMIPSYCISDAIVVPPVIATFDPLKFNVIQTQKCAAARASFQQWLANRNATLDSDWDTRLNARISNNRITSQSQTSQDLTQTLIAYCRQFTSPDENSACIYNGISQFYVQPNQAPPEGYIPMPASSGYQEGQ